MRHPPALSDFLECELFRPISNRRILERPVAGIKGLSAVSNNTLPKVFIFQEESHGPLSPKPLRCDFGVTVSAEQDQIFVAVVARVAVSMVNLEVVAFLHAYIAGHVGGEH